MDGRTLQETLQEQMGTKSLNAQKLAGITGVPERFILALLENTPEKLPASPYVRGYLTKIGAALNLDGEALWDAYTREHALPRSGAHDTLPVNRFALKAISKTKIMLVIIGIAFAVYIGFQARNFLGVPPLTITNPAHAELTTTNQQTITVSGAINPRDKLFVNGENVVPQSNGTFQKDVMLEPGLNTIEFKVSRFLGKTKTEQRQILYQPQ